MLLQNTHPSIKIPILTPKVLSKNLEKISESKTLYKKLRGICKVVGLACSLATLLRQ